MFHELIQIDVRQLVLRLVGAIELAHTPHCLRNIFDGALNGAQVLAGAGAETDFLFQQRFGVEGHRRNRIVDVMRHTAGHLAERAQALLLHGRLLALAQIVVGLLQVRVQLQLMRRQRDVFAQLPQEFAFRRTETIDLPARGDEHAEHFVFRQQRRDDQRTQAAAREAQRELKLRGSGVRLIHQLSLHAARKAGADGNSLVPGQSQFRRHRTAVDAGGHDIERFTLRPVQAHRPPGGGSSLGKCSADPGVRRWRA